MSWQPSIGAWLAEGGVRFRVWAPEIPAVDLLIETGDRVGLHRLMPEPDGFHATTIAGVADGDRYRYRLEGGDRLPDPASRFQPDGVHGPSQVVDPSRFRWSDTGWRAPELGDLIIYELHVGAFSPSGRFSGATEHLRAIADLGVTAVELMPVADFPGSRGWGYDGVDLFAPSHTYGTPEELRRLVDTAHHLGLAVLLDVVYNHLGPDGAYLGRFSPYYFTARHRSPWGAGVNLDGDRSGPVRAFFIENALHWLHDYHIDGLRLDATDAMTDEGPRPFLAELSDRIHAEAGDRGACLIAEDSRNLNHMVRPTAAGGWGLDAIWADDFHHQMRRLLAGDRDGYYRDYTGTTADLARTINDGWFYRGEYSVHAGRPRGTDPVGLAPCHFMVCLQNHDQIGNRAFGERLTHDVDAAAVRAASALLLCLPETPLLFMGQEWAASSPFLYFTDHHDELGRLVTEGRRNEFRHFARFADPEAAARIPDPQALQTFLDSRLKWDERTKEPHAGMLRLYRALIALRRHEPALQAVRRNGFRAAALDADTIALWRAATDGNAMLGVFRLRGCGTATIDRRAYADDLAHDWHPILTTEDPEFVTDSQPVTFERSAEALVIAFARPAAILLKSARAQ